MTSDGANREANPEPNVAGPFTTKFLGIGPRNWVKIVVYGLLFLNFFYYLGEDIEVARHTMRDDWNVFDWTAVFATTLDELAWFILLILFELETYLLDDAAFTPLRLKLMHGIRFVCFVFIAHTVYAFSGTVWDLQWVAPVSADLCNLVERDLSFARNLDYLALDAGNCRQLSATGSYFIFENGELVTDAAGMRIEKQLAWVDLLEVLCWLFVVGALELLVRLQERGITAGNALRSTLWVKWTAYGALWLAAAYWALRGHWIFVWDEALWILGFMAIGMNLAQWREEIDADP